jgi:hypothetical protein
MAYLNAGRLGLLGAPTYPMLRDATQSTLFEILNENGIPHEYNKADNVLILKDTKSRILFRAVEEFERLRGTNLAWFGLDELTYTQEEAWLRLEGRLRDPKATRLCGFAVWTPKGFDWVYRRFIADKVPGYTVIKARAFENRFLLDKIPDFYRRLEGSYDERFFQQEALGEYLNIHAGLVYSSFDRDVHVTKMELNPMLPLRWSLDFNYDPMSSVVAQLDGKTVNVLDEIVLRNAGTQEACEAFAQRYGSYGGRLVICGDASGYSAQTAGSTDYEIIRNFFRNRTEKPSIKAPKANPPIRDRVNLMNMKLKSAGDDVQLYVDVKCKELIKDFEQVSYKTDGYGIDKDRDRMRTHVSDALGYLLWEECRPGAAIGEKGGKFIV